MRIEKETLIVEIEDLAGDIMLSILKEIEYYAEKTGRNITKIEIPKLQMIYGIKTNYYANIGNYPVWSK